MTNQAEDFMALLREAAAVAPTVLPKAISAAVVSALGDEMCQWAPGYHELLAREVLELRAKAAP